MQYRIGASKPVSSFSVTIRIFGSALGLRNALRISPLRVLVVVEAAQLGTVVVAVTDDDVGVLGRQVVVERILVEGARLPVDRDHKNAL